MNSLSPPFSSCSLKCLDLCIYSFHKIFKHFWSLFLQIFWDLIRPLGIFPQLLMLCYFPPVFFLCFILYSLYCFVFKFTHLFFYQCTSNPSPCILYFSIYIYFFSRCLIWAFSVSSMFIPSLSSHFSSNGIIFVTVLVFLYANSMIFVIAEFISIDCAFKSCTLLIHCMSNHFAQILDIKNFILLGAGFYCITLNIVEF